MVWDGLYKSMRPYLKIKLKAERLGHGSSGIALAWQA
jgi:hypothetical protein